MNHNSVTSLGVASLVLHTYTVHVLEASLPLRCGIGIHSSTSSIHSTMLQSEANLYTWTFPTGCMYTYLVMYIGKCVK